MGMTHQSRYKLSWMKDGSRRWRKKYKGKPYYFPLREGETKESSYSRCLAAWKEKKREVDAANTSPWDVARDRVRKRMDKIASGPDTPEARNSYLILQGALSGLKWAESEGDDGEYLEEVLASSPEAFPLMMAPRSEMPDPLTDGPAPWDRIRAEPAETIAGNVPALLESKRTEANQGKISRQHAERFRYTLEDFSAFVGNKPLSALTSELLRSYHSELEKRIAEGKSASYVKNYWAAVKQFVRWLYEMERIESLPRILESKSNGLTIHLPKREIKTFTDAELKALFQGIETEHNAEDLKLYTLLMLNCGFTQKDVADLRCDEINLKAKVITRKRSKTSNHESTPVVVYPLWPETLRLLKSQVQVTGELALLNRNGNPLLNENDSEDGKSNRNDNIGLRYRRFRTRLKKNGTTINKPLKALRATGASKLGEHPVYSRFAQYFLGHSDKNPADEFYVKPTQTEFEKAIGWLRTSLKIATITKKQKKKT